MVRPATSLVITSLTSLGLNLNHQISLGRFPEDPDDGLVAEDGDDGGEEEEGDQLVDGDCPPCPGVTLH